MVTVLKGSAPFVHPTVRDSGRRDPTKPKLAADCTSI